MNADAARSLLADLLGRIAPEIDVDGVDPDASLQDAMDLDSMDFLNLMTALYEATGIDVPERDYPRLASLGGFVAYLTRVPTDSVA